MGAFHGHVCDRLDRPAWWVTYLNEPLICISLTRPCDTSELFKGLQLLNLPILRVLLYLPNLAPPRQA
jgi:hypothetical protein